MLRVAVLQVGLKNTKEISTLLLLESGFWLLLDVFFMVEVGVPNWLVV